MKLIAPLMSCLCLTSTGLAWAQDPTAPPAPAPEPAPVAAAAPVATAAPVAAPAPAPPPVPLHYLPKTRPYRDDAPPPDHYVLSDEPRRGLVIGGIVAVGVPYITGLFVAGVGMDFPNKSAFLAVPIAGPWITLATRDGCTDNTISCTDDRLARSMLMLDGIFQGLGTALLVTGFTWTKTMWIREDLAQNIDLVPHLDVARLPGDSPQGMSLIGRF